jgi:hypothetical protein
MPALPPAPAAGCCTAACPVVNVFGNLFACTAHGAEHLCDRNCRLRRHDGVRGGSVCAVSGRLFAYSSPPLSGASRCVPRALSCPLRRCAAFGAHPQRTRHALACACFRAGAAPAFAFRRHGVFSCALLSSRARAPGAMRRS